MIIGNKWFYILFGSLFTILIVINLVLWTTDIEGTSMAISNNTGTPSKFIGFQSLFDIFSTFPGPALTTTVLNKYVNVFTNFNVTGIAIIDWFVALFRLITGPIAITVTIIGDVLTNLVWLFNLLFIQSWWNIYETHESMYNMPIS